MVELRFHSVVLTGALWCVAFFVVGQAEAAEVFMRAVSVSPANKVALEVFVRPDDECLNIVSPTIRYDPELAGFSGGDLSVGDFPLVIEAPVADGRGTLEFTAAILGGVCSGEYHLGRLEFSVLAGVIAEFNVAPDSSAYLHDGQGTRVEVVGDALLVDTDVYIEELATSDDTAPIIVEAFLWSDGTVEDGARMVSVLSSDGASGVADVIIERSVDGTVASAWSLLEDPDKFPVAIGGMCIAQLPDAPDNADETLSVTVVDVAGNRRTVPVSR